MKRGFTLIELLVYMAIMSFVIIVAGRVFSDSTIMRVRSQNMVKISEIAGKVSSLIKEDISQMGAKEWGSLKSDNTFQIENVADKVYLSATDSSSYSLWHKSDDFDSILFRRAEFDDKGKFLGVREIAWAVQVPANKLVRRCRTLPLPAAETGATDPDLAVCPRFADIKDAPPVAIADSVVKFRLTPSAPGMPGNNQDTLFGKDAAAGFKLLARDPKVDIINGNIISPENIENTGTGNNARTKLSGFSQNPETGNNNKNHIELYLAVEGETETGWNNCARFKFEKGETYTIKFNMPFSISNSDREGTVASYNSTQFLPGRDHLSIGLRKYDGSTDASLPDDILFFPPQFENADISRHMEFSVKETTSNNLCVAITLAYYSPQAKSGRLEFSDFKVLRKSDEAFHFSRPGDGDYDANYGAGDPTSPTRLKDKKNVKAFDLILEIRHRGEKTGTYSGIYSTDGKEKGMLITTPGNGI
jgi:prepilin-type N-terminal cleavage/methylation domain-containing protein